MVSNIKNDALKPVRQRSFLNKDFDSLRSDLITYARTFYGENVINDFSEASLGGLLVDLAAYVGDVTSFYLDRQFSELDPDLAVETSNIESLLRRAGVRIAGAAPAVVGVSFYVEVPAVLVNGVGVPDPAYLPTIGQVDTIVSSDNGTEFVLTDDVDFSQKDVNGNLVADANVGQTNSDGSPRTFVLRVEGLCVSGNRAQETFTFGDFVPFRQITLSNPNVTEIEAVYDALGNTYYEVENLSQDATYVRRTNVGPDNDAVPELLELKPAPYRYTKDTNLDNRTTTLTFGGGAAETIEDDIIPDPSEFALPLFGKRTFTRITIDPQQLLTTRTLGVSASDTIVTIAYRYGGGLSHNAEPGSVRNVKALRLDFPGSTIAATAATVRASIAVKNLKKASGGEDPPTIDELRGRIGAARNAQSRIVTKPDLVSRVYLMPSNFGRVFRVAVRQNPNNPLASTLHVVSRDADGKLTTSPDTLKDNLKKYLNDYRMISDAIDIIDAPIINFTLAFEVTLEPSMNKRIVLQNIITKLQRLLDVKQFQIDQPIVLSDIHSVIHSTVGVMSVNALRIDSISGMRNGFQYSDVVFDVPTNTTKGMVIPEPGGIFELKFPDSDIIGKAV